MTKYHARKTFCHHGHYHDSKKEAERCDELYFMEQVSVIKNLRTQVKYELIPPQYAESKKRMKRGKLLERGVYYIADFDYIDKDGNHVVEDVKGMKTDVYKIKRKLMLHVHGIKIHEV